MSSNKSKIAKSTKKTVVSVVTNETDETNETNETKEANETNETNETIKINMKKVASIDLHIPYLNTTLECPVMLQPNQMENKLDLHLKSNLINKLEGKCYKNYGYVEKIYAIIETSEGKIEAEDPLCSAKFTVKFNCKLCIPMVNKEIICKIDRMNKALVGAINGPIKIVIPSDKINKERFFPDMYRNIRIKNSDKSDALVPNMFIKVTILSRSFSDQEKNILVIGFLNDVATPQEISQFYNGSNLNDMEEIIDEKLI